MTPDPLKQVQHLIRDGKAHDARQILTKLLYKDSANPQLWWLFAQVPENQDQLYAILDSLVDMPTNPYTGRARAALARLPYRPSEAVKKKLPVAQHAANKRLWIPLAAVVAVVILLVVAIVARQSSGTSVSAAAKSDNTQAMAASNQIAVVASKTSAPSVTPRFAGTITPPSQPVVQPTRTRQAAKATTIPPTPTAKVESSDLAAVLPDLNRAFVNRTTTLFNIVDEVSGLLEASNTLSQKAWGTIADRKDQIRTLRNEMLLLNPGPVPTEVRVKIIAPAHDAFNAYADSVLQWIDLQIQMRQLPATERVSGGSASAGSLQAPGTSSAQYSAIVDSNRKILQLALNKYSVFTAETTLRATSSVRTRIISSESPQWLNVTSGKYNVHFQIEYGAKPEKFALWLVPENETTSTLALIDSKKASTSGAKVFDLKEGRYQIKAEGVTWWVVALDPQ